MVPATLKTGDEVVFRATIVRSYSKWFAFERRYVVGSSAGGGTDVDEAAEAAEAYAKNKAAAARRGWLRAVHGAFMAVSGAS